MSFLPSSWKGISHQMLVNSVSECENLCLKSFRRTHPISAVSKMGDVPWIQEACAHFQVTKLCDVHLVHNVEVGCYVKDWILWSGNMLASLYLSSPISTQFIWFIGICLMWSQLWWIHCLFCITYSVYGGFTSSYSSEFFYCCSTWNVHSWMSSRFCW